MYILTSQSSTCAKPFAVMKSRKPAFITAVEDWLERAEIEGDAADEIRNACEAIHNTSDDVIQLEVDGLSVEVYHTYDETRI